MPKRPASGWGQVKNHKNQYKWPKLDSKNTEWSSKNRFLDQCSQSFTSRDERSEYLARFYTFISNKK
jgi:hypothetical protein